MGLNYIYPQIVQNQGFPSVHHMEDVNTATETYPKLVFLTLEKIKGFLTLIKKSTVAKKKLRVSP